MTKKKNQVTTPTVVSSKGRKNKGGKLISKNAVKLPSEPSIGNIILHLKCSVEDLEKYNENYNSHLSNPLLYTPNVPPEIQTYETISTELQYNYINETIDNHTNDNKNDIYSTPQPSQSVLKESGNFAYLTDTPSHSFVCCFCKKNNQPSFKYQNKSEKMNSSFEDTVDTVKNNNQNDISNIEEHKNETNDNETIDKLSISSINQKLKCLKIQLIKNKISDKKSACFWCSYEFDNPECYIPCYEVDNTICGYGSFCRPECAVAYLMKESIDDTTKFERYNLINQIYGKIYNYTKNIKPAPNPFYLLEKYYGNMSIEEYRKLLKSNHLLTIVEKPLTRVFPELHEENENYLLYGNNQKTNIKYDGEIQYKVKRSNDKKNDKSKISIIQEHFGIESVVS